MIGNSARGDAEGEYASVDSGRRAELKVANRAYRQRPGRDLCWAPPWPCSDARVLYDARSGDHWVLSGSAVRLVELALRPCGVDQMPAPALPLDEGGHEGDLLAELESGGILQRDAP